MADEGVFKKSWIRHSCSHPGLSLVCFHFFHTQNLARVTPTSAYHLAAGCLLPATTNNSQIRQIHPVRRQHGTYSFYLLDLDGNWWEILANTRPGGYSHAFDDPGRDITGRHDLVLSNTDHVMDDDTAAKVRRVLPDPA